MEFNQRNMSWWEVRSKRSNETNRYLENFAKFRTGQFCKNMLWVGQPVTLRASSNNRQLTAHNYVPTTATTTKTTRTTRTNQIRTKNNGKTFQWRIEHDVYKTWHNSVVLVILLLDTLFMYTFGKLSSLRCGVIASSLRRKRSSTPNRQGNPISVRKRRFNRQRKFSIKRQQPYTGIDLFRLRLWLLGATIHLNGMHSSRAPRKTIVILL